MRKGRNDAKGAGNAATDAVMTRALLVALFVLAFAACEESPGPSVYTPTAPTTTTSAPAGPRCDAGLIESDDWWHRREYSPSGFHADVRFKVHYPGGLWICPESRPCSMGGLDDPDGTYELRWWWLACQVGYCNRDDLRFPD